MLNTPTSDYTQPPKYNDDYDTLKYKLLYLADNLSKLQISARPYGRRNTQNYFYDALSSQNIFNKVHSLISETDKLMQGQTPNQADEEQQLIKRALHTAYLAIMNPQFANIISLKATANSITGHSNTFKQLGAILLGIVGTLLTLTVALSYPGIKVIVKASEIWEKNSSKGAAAAVEKMANTLNETDIGYNIRNGFIYPITPTLLKK